MYKGKKFLAIVPARAGSKGLPGKNTKELCGKPLIVWSIESGLNSQYIDRLIVSTDSVEIADIAINYNADVPFMRPSALAGDRSKTFDVLKHAIDYIDEAFDYVVLLEPTSPLREALDIDLAIETLIESEAESIVGVGRTESQHPEFLVNMDDKGYISGYESTTINAKRRQDISEMFFLEGSIYISDIKTLLDKETFYHTKTIGYKFPRYKTIEIDSIEDFIMAEAIMNYKKKNT